MPQKHRYTRKEEAEANRFAIELLMPKDSVVNHFNAKYADAKANRDKVVTGMANDFEVEDSLMLARMVELGLIM